MSDDKHDGKHEEWIQAAITEGHINFYPFDDFFNRESLGEGAFGIVHRADWKSRYMQVAIKTLKARAKPDKKFVNELKVLRKVSYCPYINQFCGVTRNPSGSYALVLQYAKENLNDYLKRKFSGLDWKGKLKIAMEISIGLACLHEENIIHRDLHAMNVLVHNDRMAISDFGFSKFEESNSASSKTVFGDPAYLDPNIRERHEITRKSDIFSLGMLLWQISSGKRPLEETTKNRIRMKALMIDRKWDPHVTDAPESYKALTDKCRKEKPEQRPDIHEVVKELQSEELQQIDRISLTVPANSLVVPTHSAALSFHPSIPLDSAENQ